MVDWRDAKIHVLTHTLHYYCGAFEGVRAYNTVNGPAIFRLEEHPERRSTAQDPADEDPVHPGRGERGQRPSSAKNQLGVGLPPPLTWMVAKAGREPKGQHDPPDGGGLGLGRLPGRRRVKRGIG